MKKIEDVQADLVEVWHEEAPKPVDLHTFLGMTREQYEVWATEPSKVEGEMENYWRWLHGRLF